MLVRNNRNTSQARRGAAVVELAVCLPMLLLITLGTLEVNSMIYLKKSLKIIAYEGARVALITDAENSNVQAQCNEIIANRQIKNATVSISPDVGLADPGDILKISVSAPCSDNGFFTSLFFGDQKFTESVYMMKEH